MAVLANTAGYGHFIEFKKTFNRSIIKEDSFRKKILYTKVIASFNYCRGTGLLVSCRFVVQMAVLVDL